MFKRVRFSARVQIAAMVIANLAVLIGITSCVEPVKKSAEPADTAAIYEAFPAATGITRIDDINGVWTNTGHLGEPEISGINGPEGVLGYSVKAAVTSRSGPFSIGVLLDERLYVKQAMVLRYPANRGGDVRKRSFTDQFTGKGPNDPIKVGSDIDAMTGATISSKVMAGGVGDIIKLVGQIKEIQK